MFSEYVTAALKRAKYDMLENGSYMATVEGLRGVIATGKTIEECQDLIEVTRGLDHDKAPARPRDPCN